MFRKTICFCTLQTNLELSKEQAILKFVNLIVKMNDVFANLHDILLWNTKGKKELL